VVAAKTSGSAIANREPCSIDWFDMVVSCWGLNPALASPGAPVGDLIDGNNL
jgi:hypothetical protein